jgi:hypothetical protein
MVVNVCPGMSGQQTSNQTSRSQFETMAATQTLLLPTLAAVQTYAKPQLGPSTGTRPAAQDFANPSDRYGSIGIGGPWDHQVVFLPATGTTADRQQDADALTKLVPRPDRVVVCPTALSEARGQQITNELMTRFPCCPDASVLRFYGIESFTPTGGRIPVHLRSDSVALAADLQRTYGSEIMLSVGNFSWPDPNSPGPGSDLAKRCGTVAQTQSPSLRWKGPSLVTVRSGAAINIVLTVRNQSKTTLLLGPMKAVVVAEKTRRVVAIQSQQVAYAAVAIPVPPKAAQPVRVTVGTDACDAAAGWALPPGTYQVIVVNALAADGAGTVRSPPLRLIVTE